MSLELTLNGQVYNQFKGLSLHRSLLQACAQLQLDYAGYETIAPATAFTLTIDGHLAITGFMDAVSHRLTSTGISRQAFGRDKAADLVDCSVPPTATLNGLTLDLIANRLAAPYGVKVRIDQSADLGKPFDTWSLDPGESIWAAIEKACRARALLAVCTNTGELLLTRAGNSRRPTALIEGQNVLEAQYQHDLSGRFQIYHCLAQQANGNVQQWSRTGAVNDADQAQAHAKAIDSGARAPRRLSIVQDSNADANDLPIRVQWECNVRRGKSQTVQITVQGFSAGGQLWQPNQLVSIDLPSLNLGGTWLIESVVFTLNNEGRKTDLTLVPPSAYSLIPEPPKVQESQQVKQWSRES